MWCATHIKEISDRMKKLKETNAGTYKGLELRGVDDDALEQRPVQESTTESETDLEHKAEEVRYA